MSALFAASPRASLTPAKARNPAAAHADLCGASVTVTPDRPWALSWRRA